MMQQQCRTELLTNVGLRMGKALVKASRKEQVKDKVESWKRKKLIQVETCNS